jgi:hypothetical protein
VAIESLGGRDFFKENLEWIGKWTKLRQYFRTRRLVLEREDVFDLSDEELKSRDLMSGLFGSPKLPPMHFQFKWVAGCCDGQAQLCKTRRQIHTCHQNNR